jgi:hypothetical protein
VSLDKEYHVVLPVELCVVKEDNTKVVSKTLLEVRGLLDPFDDV